MLDISTPSEIISFLNFDNEKFEDFRLYKFFQAESFIYNELFSLSSDNKLLEREEERLHNEKLKHQKIYGTKYYDTKSLEFKSNLLVNSIFLVACIVVISILEKNGKIAFGYVINGILIIILAIYLSLSLYDLRDRQFSNWDKKYFHYAVDRDTV